MLSMIFPSSFHNINLVLKICSSFLSPLHCHDHSIINHVLSISTLATFPCQLYLCPRDLALTALSASKAFLLDIHVFMIHFVWITNKYNFFTEIFPLPGFISLQPVLLSDRWHTYFLVYFQFSSSQFKTQESEDFALCTESQCIEQCLALNGYLINT